MIYFPEEKIVVHTFGGQMNKDFIAISDYVSSEIQDILDLAIRLKKMEYKKAGGNHHPSLKQSLGIFSKTQLAHACLLECYAHLGGDALYLSPNEIGLANANPLLTSPV
jgi:ornithine carbamoyltransferase